jgi:hypothetical protein
MSFSRRAKLCGVSHIRAVTGRNGGDEISRYKVFEAGCDACNRSTLKPAGRLCDTNF